MKHLFIVNPTAGGKDRTEEVRAKVGDVFRNLDANYEIYVTKCAMDAPGKIRQDAAMNDCLRVYACGGDGTFNECVSGAIGLENVAVCPFPTGTGNDFCRMFGEEKDLYRDLGALMRGSEHYIDLIRCNDRYCTNICSVGIDARIGTSVHNYSKIPVIGGATGYVVSLIVNVFKGINRHMRVRIKDFYVDEELALVCVCNGRYYGGGFNPSLTARPDDGVLDVFVVKKVGLITLARLLGKYASGHADECPQYITRIQTDEVSINFDEDNVINIDGEAVFSKDVNIHVIHNAVKLIVPAGMTFFEQTSAETASV